MTIAQGKSSQPAVSFIDDFTETASNIGIPPSYIEWAGIYIVACAMGRHVYSINARGITYPNLYIMFIGHPSTGKSEAEDLIAPFFKDLALHPVAQHVSKAALIDELGDSHIKRVMNKTTFVDYHHCIILSSEFTETFPTYDTHLLGMLSRWWDCPASVRERKRHMGDPVEIPSVCCNMLTGIQPGILAQSFPAEAWSGGFLSRTIFVYVPEKISFYLRSLASRRDEVHGGKISPEDQRRLGAKLKSIGELHGEMSEDEGFVNAYLKWRDGGQEPVPPHPRMTHYNGRREHELEKLAMISAASRLSMSRTEQDYIQARAWLESAEANISDVFVEMNAGDDIDLMTDLHAFITAKAKGVNKPVRESIVRRYLAGKIPSQRQESFLDVTERAGYITVHAMTNGFRTVSANIAEDFERDG